MKNLIITLSILFYFSQFISAQDTAESNFRKNEIKVNLLYTVFEIVELTYERQLAEEFAVGISAAAWFNNDDIQFISSPYFRFYPFPYRPSAGFFIEGNAAVAVVEEDNFEYVNGPNGYVYLNNVNTTNEVRGGAGFAAGFKFISTGSFVAEGYIGIGRIFGQTEFSDLFYPRVGISFGKRF